MQPAPKQLYCQVNPKTGKVVDGPRELPQKWGNISGFDNLRPKDLAKYHWYPMADYSLVHEKATKYGLVFLPEKGVVMKTPEDAPRGLRDSAVAHLAMHFQHNTAGREIASSVLGPIYFFPNSVTDQVLRLTCMLTGAHYECMARSEAGMFERVLIPNAAIPHLLEDVMKNYKKRLSEYEAGVARVIKEDENGLRALFDTSFVEFYDD